MDGDTDDVEAIFKGRAWTGVVCDAKRLTTEARLRPRTVKGWLSFIA